MAEPDDPDGPGASGAPDAPAAGTAGGAASGAAPDDRRVKELLDAKTLADLERWFGLPSFTELAERKLAAEPPPDDPEMVARREQRDKALAAVDPALLEHRYRRIASYEAMLDGKRAFELRIDPEMSLIDHAMIESKTADPREIEISDELRDDLAECTPQAILRDLHRPELFFDKQFEIVDIAAEQRLDIVAEVARAMSTDWRPPPAGQPLAEEGRALLAYLRAERRRDVTADLASLPNRLVTES